MFTRKVNVKYTSPISYYNQASSLQNLDKISVPTLVLHAADDPITPIDCVPFEELMKNEKIITAITPRGSHVCWFTDSLGRQRWFPNAAAEFLK